MYQLLLPLVVLQVEELERLIEHQSWYGRFLEDEEDDYILVTFNYDVDILRIVPKQLRLPFTENVYHAPTDFAFRR